MKCIDLVEWGALFTVLPLYVDRYRRKWHLLMRSYSFFNSCKISSTLLDSYVMNADYEFSTCLVYSLSIVNLIPWLNFHQVHYLEGQSSVIRYQTAVFSYAGYQETSCLFSFNKTGIGLSIEGCIANFLLTKSPFKSLSAHRRSCSQRK